MESSQSDAIADVRPRRRLTQIFAAAVRRRRKSIASGDAIADGLSEVPERSIEAFFTDYDRISSPRPLRISFFVTSLVVVLYVLTFFVQIKIGTVDSKSREMRELLTFLASLSSAIVAGFIAVRFTNSDNIRKLNTVRKIAHDGILKQILIELSKYNNRHSENRVVELKLASIIFDTMGKPTAVKCILSVSQSMHLRERTRLGFRVINETTYQGRSPRSLVAEDALEDFISIDITNLLATGHVDYSQMGLKEVIIDGNIQAIEEGDEQAPTRIWSFDTSRYYNARSPTHLSYRYEYLLDVPGFAFFETHQPTKGFTCILDIEAVSNHIDVYEIETLRPNEFSHPTRQNDTRIIVTNPDWILPRRNVVFAWYIKAAPTAPQPDAASDLSPDGNCLGVALTDAANILGKELENQPLPELRSIADAIKAASQLGKVKQLLPSNPGMLERMVHWISSPVRNLSAARVAEVRPGDVILVLRSVAQIYRFDEPPLDWKATEGHWFIMVRQEETYTIIDRLAPEMRDQLGATPVVDGDEILRQPGFNLWIAK